MGRHPSSTTVDQKALLAHHGRPPFSGRRR
jgi:hypothetical protein